MALIFEHVHVYWKKEIGFNGKPTTQGYTVENIVLMLNSIYHVTQNYVEPIVDSPLVINYDYIPKED